MNKYFLLIAIGMIACNKKPVLKINTENLATTDSIRTLKIYNTGNADLIIEDFTSSCECILININKGKTILPNDSLICPLKIKKKSLDSDNLVFVTLKTNAVPRLTSFKFKP
jgi:hypothetical protein